MKSKNARIILASTATSIFLFAQAAHAISWQWGGENNLWSNPGNWEGGVVPNSNADEAAFLGSANVAIDVDADFTIRNYFDGFGGEGFIHTLYGDGTLTIDRNSATAVVGINNATGDSQETPEDPGGTLRFNGGLTINNSQGNIATLIQNANSANNVLLFDTGCRLKFNTLVETRNSAVGTIHFNCRFITGSTANLRFNSRNVFFGEGHDSTNFGNDLIFLANSKLTVNGGTVLAPGRKFQVNGTGASLELNAADVINGANVVVGSTGLAHNFLVDVNANQSNMGAIQMFNGVLTIDVDPAVSTLSFAKSAEQLWGSGSITIEGFKENTIRFGEDATGLTAEQLAVINDGTYSLTPSGYLTALPPGSGYESWASSQVPPITGGANGDDDNDGVLNLIEYALADGAERGLLSGNTITFTKRGAPYGGDISYVIEVSTNLGITDNWKPAVSGVTESASSISYQFPASAPEKNFARLKVMVMP